MPLGTPFYTIVFFTPHWVPNGSSNFRTRAVPMMLFEAVAKALTSLSEGHRPAIEIDGAVHTEADFFHALRMRADFPD